ncbi:12844_t:CDS:2, partial [Ambispora leptoticha]
MASTSTTEQTPLLGNGSNAAVIDEENANLQPANRKFRQGGVVALLIFITIMLLIFIFLPHNRPEETHEDIVSPRQITKNIFEHLNQFYLIAQNHNESYSSSSTKQASTTTKLATFDFDEENFAIDPDNPAPSRSVTTGYNASAQYIISLLTNRTRCDIQLQYFKVPIWEKFREAELNVTYLYDDVVEDNGKGMNSERKKQDAKQAITYQGGVDFWSMRYGGQAANLTNKKIAVIPSHGCSDKGWEDVKDKIALIQEGGQCELWISAYTAELKGASAVIFYNSASRTKLLFNRVRIVDWKEGDPIMKIPVLAASFSLGQLLAFSKDKRIDLRTYTKISIVDTYNVICSLKDGGRKENTLVFGAHLDSVPAGPGLVDNASGSSTLLEILLSLEKTNFTPKNHLVFAWWGAEEIGLLGSRHFVQEAVMSGENENIALNLNFDMLGSPNYVPFIHRGEDAPEDVRNASIVIQNTFENFFKSIREPYELIDMVAGSDFLPFIEHGIPSGGVLTGAGGLKSEEQRHTFKGFAHAPYDPCYHRSCDTLENVSEDAISLMSQAAFHVIKKFATDKQIRQSLG